MSEATNKYKDLFCTEAEDQLAILSSTLLSLEQNPDSPDLYATLMRSAHTIKGASATMGYNEMAKLAHALEDLFHACERKAMTLGPNEVSLALASVDHIARSLVSIKDKDTELTTAEEVTRLLAVLEQHSKTESPQRVAASVPRVPSEHGVDVPLSVPSSVRVGVDRLDTLMGLFEEMLMLRLKLDTILAPALSITKTIIDPAIKQKIYFLNEFNSLFSTLGRLLSETQEELLQIRLVPLEQIFSQFPRMVRDLALREGKQITFHSEGGEVLLDRTVLEGLGGALAHLVRNAVDHGIVQAGNITLSAKRVNERVDVSVTDNGAGIDYARVREVAIEKGIVSAEEAGPMRESEVAELLFHANMSTNKEVTDISGRGVGLSAVRAFAQDVGGRVTIISPTNGEKGGTQFLIDLPISLATVKVLLVGSSGFTFALPFSAVVRTFSFPSTQILKMAHQETVVVQDRAVPLLRLDQLLGITFARMLRTESKLDRDVLAVLITTDVGEAALIVDEYAGEKELLVKSLPPILRDIKGFSGSTLLPDGRTILLLDAHGLLQQAFNDILKSTQPEITNNI